MTFKREVLLLLSLSRCEGGKMCDRSLSLSDFCCGFFLPRQISLPDLFSLLSPLAKGRGKEERWSFSFRAVR